MDVKFSSLSVNTLSNYAKATGKKNEQENVSSFKPQQSSHDKLISNLQEQIKRINESDNYTTDEKKAKIEELQKQLEQAEAEKRLKEAEALKGEAEKTSVKNESNDQNKVNATNEDGDTLSLSFDAESLIKAQMSLDNMKDASALKTKLKGESNILKSEIELDKSRGVNTAKKEEQLSTMENGVRKSEENVGKAIKNANESIESANNYASDKASNKPSDKASNETSEDSEDTAPSKASKPTEL